MGTRRAGLGWTITDQGGVEGQGHPSRVTYGIKTSWKHPKGDCELCNGIVLLLCENRQALLTKARH